MSTLRIPLALLILAAAGTAGAFEVSEVPLAKSMLSRAEVRADAHTAARAPGEIDDGRPAGRAPALASTLTRDEVRMQARANRATRNDDYIGG